MLDHANVAAMLARIEALGVDAMLKRLVSVDAAVAEAVARIESLDAIVRPGLERLRLKVA